MGWSLELVGRGYSSTNDWWLSFSVSLLCLGCRSVTDENIWGTGHLFFYVADEGGNAISVGGDVVDIHESSLLASGLRSDIGAWQLHLESAVCCEMGMASFYCCSEPTPWVSHTVLDNLLAVHFMHAWFCLCMFWSGALHMQRPETVVLLVCLPEHDPCRWEGR